jgi:exopolysaccharide biosynthesis protein
VYWLSDSDLVAPEPDQNCYGEATEPAGLSWLLEDAAALLDGQDTLFNPDVQILPGSKVSYYLDETILAVTWKQVMDNSVYTISEIKIAHPSQFRRFLAGGEYSSGAQYMVSEMAASVNAVVAANGDFYGFRNQGIVVYDSQLMRMEGEKLDVCLLDRNGDLRFLYAGQMTEQAEVEAYLEENGVRFSLAFGPILIDNGVIQNVERPYPIGSGFKKNARAALCQLDSLHYLLVAVSAEPPYAEGHELSVFSENLLEMGCTMAYNLDGGQSATIVMNDEVKNYVYERRISDIIYFATALPEGE